MLPPRLRKIRELLDGKGHSGRSSGEDELLDELKSLDDQTEKTKGDWIESVERYSTSHGYMGPALGTCPTCGKGW